MYPKLDTLSFLEMLSIKCRYLCVFFLYPDRLNSAVLTTFKIDRTGKVRLYSDSALPLLFLWRTENCHSKNRGDMLTATGFNIGLSIT